MVGLANPRYRKPMMESDLASPFLSPRYRAIVLARAFLRQDGARLCRYLVVGGSGVVVNMGLLYVLVEAGHLNHVLAAAISSIVSIFTNFELNDCWTFRDRKETGSWWSRVVQYYAVCLFGLVFSLGLLAALTMVLGIHYMLANLFSLGTAMVTNYALNSRVTWRATGGQPEIGKILQFPVPAEFALAIAESNDLEIG